MLPLDGAVLETEWTTAPLPITVEMYPRSVVDNNAIQVVTFYELSDNLPKLLVSLRG